MASEGRPTARLRLGAVALAVVTLLGAGAAIVLVRTHGTSHVPGAGTRPAPAASQAGASAAGGGPSTSTSSSTTTTLPPPIDLTSVTPANGARDVRYRQAVTVSFSEPLAPASPHPALTPAVPGYWTRTSATTWRFVPAANYPPLQRIVVTVPGGTSGVTAVSGVTLASSRRTAFEVAGPSVLRLQELLAELDYLPVAFVPAAPPAPAAPAGPSGGTAAAPSGASTTTAPPTAPATGSTGLGSTGSTVPASGSSGSSGAQSQPGSGGTRLSSAAAGDASASVAVARLEGSASSPAGAGAVKKASSANVTASAASALSVESTQPDSVDLAARPGDFVWRFPDIPSQLAAQWAPGAWNTVTQGAVMAFEYAAGLDVDGQPGPAVWKALLTAVAKRQVDPSPYDYLLVTETVPETLYVWRDGTVVYQTLVNTGVPGASTELGTFPVYLRYTVTTMSGTNPDGTHYVDPGIPWVSYFNGSDAVHGFVRSGYGYPQSDGCVELPIANAQVVFPMDGYGTLVTVTTGDLSTELGVPPLAIDLPPAPPPTPTTTTTTPRVVRPAGAHRLVGASKTAPGAAAARAAAQRAAAAHAAAVRAAAAHAAAVRAAAAHADAVRAAAAHADAVRAAAAHADAVRAAAAHAAAAAAAAAAAQRAAAAHAAAVQAAAHAAAARAAAARTAAAKPTPGGAAPE